MREGIGSDFRRAADDLSRLGHRYLEMGREWIDEWRMQMNRNREQGYDPRRERPQAWEREREQAETYRGAPRATGWVSGQRHQEPRADRMTEELAGSAYEAGYGGAGERPYEPYARGGYESGYGGPGGYAARAGYEAGYGGERWRGGYGGSDYRRDEGYAGRYDEPRSSGERGGQRRHAWDDRSALSGYRGLGPKNYSRSDERIREDLCERLADADDIDASQIDVSVHSGIVGLQGEVQDRWMKYRAEDLADRCTGVKDVQNDLRVSTRSASHSRYSPTGRSQQRAQQDYERGRKEDMSSGEPDRTEDTSRH